MFFPVGSSNLEEVFYVGNIVFTVSLNFSNIEKIFASARIEPAFACSPGNLTSTPPSQCLTLALHERVKKRKMEMKKGEGNNIVNGGRKGYRI